jgi:hypothetical protein
MVWDIAWGIFWGATFVSVTAFIGMVALAVIGAALSKPKE